MLTYSVAGTATAGGDYTALSGTVTCAFKPAFPKSRLVSTPATTGPLTDSMVAAAKQSVGLPREAGARLLHETEAPDRLVHLDHAQALFDRLGENDAPDIGTYDNKFRNRYS